MTLTYPRDIFGDRTGTWDDRPSTNWLGWDIFWAQVAGQRLNMGGGSGYIDRADAIGSTVMETDPSGAVNWDVVNGPWGQAWQQTGTRQSQVFAGMDWQVNDPLVPSATREYSDGLGRWMTPDPVGTKVVSLANPQTWNMYAYVTDNPTTLNDPSGLHGTCSAQVANENSGCEAADPNNVQDPTLVDGAFNALNTLLDEGAYLQAAADTLIASGAAKTHPHSESINLAYEVACSLSVEGCKAGQQVRVRYVGFTFNVQITGDPFDPGSLPLGAMKDPALFNAIFHPGSSASYYMTSFFGLFGPTVAHIVAGRSGVSAHIDHWGPLNPLHWGEAGLSRFVNTAAEAGKGIPEVCDPEVGCQ